MQGLLLCNFLGSGGLVNALFFLSIFKFSPFDPFPDLLPYFLSYFLPFKSNSGNFNFGVAMSPFAATM